LSLAFQLSQPTAILAIELPGEQTAWLGRLGRH